MVALAFVIAGGNKQIRSLVCNILQVRRNNRCLQINRKGYKPSIRRKHYLLQPHNLVRYNGQVIVIGGGLGVTEKEYMWGRGKLSIRGK